MGATSFIQDLSNWDISADTRQQELSEVRARFVQERARRNLRRLRLLFWVQRFLWNWSARAWAPGHPGHHQAVAEWNTL